MELHIEVFGFQVGLITLFLIVILKEYGFVEAKW